MALESLKESFGDAFTPELQQELEGKIDNLVESRAQVIADEKVQDAKTELNTKCEEFKSKLEEESKSIVNENLNKLNDTINSYVDRVVEDFVNEHLEIFTANEDELKNTAIRESVSNACKIAGVTLSMIDEGISEQGIASERENKLKEQLTETQNENFELKRKLTESYKMGVISELSYDLNEDAQKKFERIANDVEFCKNREYVDKLKSIKERLVEDDPSALVSSKEDELNESLENANKQIKELKATNENLIQMGIVNELKCNLSESDAKRFERIASQIRYTNAKEYLREMKDFRKKFKDCSEETEEFLDRINELEAKVSDLQTENKTLKKKNDELIQQGVINELKEGLTIVEAEKFEKLAKDIPFAKNEDYFNKLNELKKTVCEHQSEVRETRIERASVNESLSDLLVEGLNSLDKTVRKKPVHSLQDMLNGL